MHDASEVTHPAWCTQTMCTVSRLDGFDHGDHVALSQHLDSGSGERIQTGLVQHEGDDRVFVWLQSRMLDEPEVRCDAYLTPQEVLALADKLRDVARWCDKVTTDPILAKAVAASR